MYILMRLKGIQSWGNHTYTQTAGAIRGTNLFPSYSGIIGLISCSMGINQKKDKEKFKELKNKICFFDSYWKNEIDLLNDYQTIGGNYNANDEFESMMIPRTTKGTIPVSNGWNKSMPSRSKISNRDYISNGDFMVILSIDDSIANDVIESLKNPVWFPVLGRANCIPSTRIFQNASYNINQLIEEMKNIWNHDGKILCLLNKPNENRYSEQTIYDVPDCDVQFKFHSRTAYKTFI
jgi:CRISPR system Cascade subunit CasD